MRHADQQGHRRHGRDRHVERKVPRVDERQRSQGQGQRHRLARALPQPAQPGRDGRHHQRQRQREPQRHEGQRGHVRVQVAQQEAEERHFRDGVVQRRPRVRQRVDHPGSPPPPPEPVGQPTVAACGRLQTLDRHPLPEPVPAHASNVCQLQHAGQVPQHRNPDRREQPRSQRRERPRTGQAQHVVHNPQYSGGQEGWDGGHGQVVRLVRSHTGKGRQHGRHVVPTVVVGDAVP